MSHADAVAEEAKTTGREPVVQEAIDRYKSGNEWESTWHERAIADDKFAEADADNGYQWPDAIRRNRDIDKRPCLTLNITRQHNLQIVNEQLQNKSQMKIRATGGGANVDSAGLFQALINQIEYRSNAQAAYARACDFQVKIGCGYWRLATDYVSHDSFDQEIKILAVADPLRVFIDPDAKEPDQSDARWGIVFDLVPNDQFRKAYPEFADKVGNTQPLGALTGDSDWIRQDHTRVCEYFRKVETPDVLASFIDPGEGVRKTLRKSHMPKAVWEAVKALPTTRLRSTKTETVEWYLIAGDQEIDSTIWPGRYIPFVRVLGEEVVIEGILDRKGHTRAMKDAQRMFNYNSSAQVEFVALQSKTPWIAAAKAIEEYESMWNSANNVNHSVLIYNDVDPEYPDRTIAPPQRTPPPTASPAYQEGMQTAFNQMMMTSGQWQNAMGMVGNERTGAAIKERQAQSDTSVYHFQNNYEQALRYCGKQVLDLIPKVYDTKRLMKLVLDSGEDVDVQLDPGAGQVLQQQYNAAGEVVMRVLNPQMGEYEVQADVGPAFGTRRRETVEALTLILTQAPALTGVIGDLLLSAMDFDKAQEAAMRLRRMIPPQALGKGPSPQEQQLQAQLGQSQAALAKALQQYGEAEIKLRGKAEMRDIDAYKAHTDRVKALAALLPTDPTELQQLIDELGDDTVSETLRPIYEANKKATGEETEGGTTALASAPAKPSAPAEWTLRNPQAGGRYTWLGPLMQERVERGVVGNG